MIQPCKSHIGLPLLQRFAYIWAFAIINRLGTHGLRQLSFCSTFCTPTSTSPIFIPALLSFSRFEVTVSSGDFYKPLRSRAVLPIHCSRGDTLQVKVHLTPQLPIARQRQRWQLESFRRSCCTEPWPWTLWEMYAASQLFCIRPVCRAVLKARIPSNLPTPITEGTHFDERIKTIHTWLDSDFTLAVMPPTASDRPASEEQEHVQQLSCPLPVSYWKQTSRFRPLETQLPATAPCAGALCEATGGCSVVWLADLDGTPLAAPRYLSSAGPPCVWSCLHKSHFGQQGPEKRFLFSPAKNRANTTVITVKRSSH